MTVPPLTNNTTKMSFGEDLVKIHPAVAEQSPQKKETGRPSPLKYKTSLSPAASGAV